MGVSYDNTARAFIDDGARVSAEKDVTVQAATENLIINLAESGGKARDYGISGAFAKNDFTNEALAYVEETATAALDLIDVRYEPLRPITDAEDAVRHPEPRIHDYGEQGNIHRNQSYEFGEVDEALGQNLFRLMREGPDEELRLTENAQPAIMAHSLAVFRALTREGGVDLAKAASFVAGHSLGEYSALCAAGSFDLATTAKLLKLRGQAMQQAVPVGEGAMAEGAVAADGQQRGAAAGQVHQRL